MTALTQDRIQQIENMTLDLLVEIYGSVSNIKSPVDLSPLFEKYGIQIFASEFDSRDISGKYIKNKKEIHVRDGDSYTRQIFTAAHELGHFFLHNDKYQETYFRVDQFIIDDEAESLEEKEANWFAASLLMPRPVVENIVFITKKIDEIASLFSVSNSTAYYRLKNLGMFMPNA